MSDLPEGATAPGDDEILDTEIAEGDEAEPELEPGEVEPDPEQVEEQPSQPRHVRREERARVEARRLAEENADLARRLQMLEQRQTQPAVDPQATAREEAAFRQSLETMLPHEAALAVATRTEQRMQAQLMQAELRGFDRADVAEFNALRAWDRSAERLSAQVEQLLAQNRAQGDLRFGRMDIFDLLRGRELRTRGPQTAQTQRRNGAARVAAQTTRPANGRGDVARGAGQGRDQDAADEALLRGITAADL